MPTSRCHAGFFDPSIGHCICLPGWSGPRCETAYLGACLMSPYALVAPCDGYMGVMSCQCRRDCAALHYRPTLLRSDRAICWTSDGLDELRSSALPPNASAVHFWAPQRTWRLAQMQEETAGMPRFKRADSRSAVELFHRIRVPRWAPLDEVRLACCEPGREYREVH